jgi:DNA-binding response OmpR family regulator
MASVRILVIDDEEAITTSIERTLRNDYQISVAHSGIQGIKTARRFKPDLIILDVRMPGMDGYETCRELRQDPLLKATPILFLSAISTVESKIKGLEAGADDYLVKPFNVRELQLRVKAILRRISAETEEAPSEMPKTIKQGDITLDSQSYEVKTRKGIAYLTPIEFDLLYYFLSHPDEVFTSARLLQDIWDYPTDTGSPDLVRMHIKNLRNKIEPNPQRPIYIKTIPRHGYIMPINHSNSSE